MLWEIFVNFCHNWLQDSISQCNQVNASLLSYFSLKLSKYQYHEVSSIDLYHWTISLNITSSVADPDPGSRIRCLFDPWIWDPGSGIRDGQKVSIRIRDEQPWSYFLELRNNFLGLKYLNSLMRIRDLGSGMETIRIQDPGWKKVGSGIQDPG